MSHLQIICGLDPGVFIQANCGIFDPSFGHVGQHGSENKGCADICFRVILPALNILGGLLGFLHPAPWRP